MYLVQVTIPSLALQDNAFPYIVPTLDTQGAVPAPLPWHLGSMLVHIQQSVALRLSLRGLLFSKSPILESAIEQWSKFDECQPTAECLCTTTQNLTFFSTTHVDIADTRDNMTQNAYTKIALYGDVDVCQSSTAGRTVKVGDSQYEVSLCDILDLNMHFVYDPHSSTMYYKQDKSSVVELILVAVVSIFFVSSLSHNLITIFSPASTETSSHSKRQQTRIQAAMVLCTLVYCIAYFVWVAPGFLLTNADTVLCLHLCLFIILEGLGQVWIAYCNAEYKAGEPLAKTLLHAMATPVHPDSDGYVSILTACLLLLSCRVHYTFDTPYLQVLVVVFGTRSVYKLFRVLHGVTIAKCRPLCVVEYCLQVVDVFIFSSLLGNGIALSTYTDLDGLLATQTTYFFALCLGCLLWLLRGLPHLKRDVPDSESPE